VNAPNGGYLRVSPTAPSDGVPSQLGARLAVGALPRPERPAAGAMHHRHRAGGGQRRMRCGNPG